MRRSPFGRIVGSTVAILICVALTGAPPATAGAPYLDRADQVAQRVLVAVDLGHPRLVQRNTTPRAARDLRRLHAKGVSFDHPRTCTHDVPGDATCRVGLIRHGRGWGHLTLLLGPRKGRVLVVGTGGREHT